MEFIVGINRNQTYFTTPGDQVAADNPIRLIDAFVETFDLEKLGFKGIAHKSEDHPPFTQGVLLKLYLYGNLNKIRSCRKLQKEFTAILSYSGYWKEGDATMAKTLTVYAPAAKQEYSSLLKYLAKEGLRNPTYC